MLVIRHPNLQVEEINLDKRPLVQPTSAAQLTTPARLPGC
jgi:hypothetical protein